MSTFKIELHRVNPITNFCDDTGRKSVYYDSCCGLVLLRAKAKNAFKESLKLKPNYDFFDFDKDVYFVEITNLVTNKSHIIV